MIQRVYGVLTVLNLALAGINLYFFMFLAGHYAHFIAYLETFFMGGIILSKLWEPKVIYSKGVKVGNDSAQN